MYLVTKIEVTHNLDIQCCVLQNLKNIKMAAAQSCTAGHNLDFPAVVGTHTNGDVAENLQKCLKLN